MFDVKGLMNNMKTEGLQELLAHQPRLSLLKFSSDFLQVPLKL